jgi:iron-sulfur cluster repair protein YtfE (RIC family)
MSALGELLSKDHKHIRQLVFDINNSTSIEDKLRLMESLQQAMLSHTICEEKVLHPTVMEEMDDGEKWCKMASRNNAEVNKLIAEMKNLRVTDATDFSDIMKVNNGIRKLFAKLDKRIDEHIEEQNRLLPALEKKIGQEKINVLYNQLHNMMQSKANIGKHSMDYPEEESIVTFTQYYKAL